MKQFIARFVKNDEGQDLVEYAFLVGFIALAVIAAVTILGTTLNNFYQTIASSVEAAPTD
jgi:Flp pilus assembly pilin Flp